MKFRSYDSLRIFDAVARTQSMTIASQDLNLSKGSISYQINKLEMELGFVLFDRLNARLQLTDAGLRLWHASHNALTQIDREIDDLRGTKLGSLSIGALTYFSSRWLSPKLMSFFESNGGDGETAMAGATAAAEELAVSGDLDRAARQRTPPQQPPGVPVPVPPHP